MPLVKLDWIWLDYLPTMTWKKDILPKLKNNRLLPHHIKRCVYVLRLNGTFAVDYPTGISPVVYIGEGSLGARLQSHKKWLKELLPLIGEYHFQIAIAIPRVTGAASAYKDLEALLLDRFAGLYGSAPLKNKQFETRKYEHSYLKSAINEPLKIGKGVRFHWAVKPMKASKYHSVFMQTHV